MNKEDIKELLKQISEHKISVDAGLETLSELPFSDLGCANHDNHRPLRNGFSEVIYCLHKTKDQIKSVLNFAIKKKINIFGTKLKKEIGKDLVQEFDCVEYDELSETLQIINKPIESKKGDIAICCAGTADIKVGEEAARLLRFYGFEPKKYYDVGVAGIHRLLNKKDEIKKADILIVIAGMEGALPSVMAGLFSQPIIAVPTSTGYGTSFNGITALFAMLNSCAEGISVVNIDNGFGAACSAIRILNSLYE